MRLIRRINRETDYRKCDYCERTYEQQFVQPLGRSHICCRCLDLKLENHEQSVGVSVRRSGSLAGVSR
jgi:hypothetical protein